MNASIVAKFIGRAVPDVAESGERPTSSFICLYLGGPEAMPVGLAFRATSFEEFLALLKIARGRRFKDAGARFEAPSGTYALEDNEIPHRLEPLSLEQRSRVQAMLMS